MVKTTNQICLMLGELLQLAVESVARFHPAPGIFKEAVKNSDRKINGIMVTFGMVMVTLPKIEQQKELGRLGCFCLDLLGVAARLCS